MNLNFAGILKGLKVSIDPSYVSDHVDSIPLYRIGPYVAKELDLSRF